MKNLILFCLVILSFSVYSQKPLHPNSCYQLKSKMGSFSAAASSDNRGDFIDIVNYKIDLDISDFTNKKIYGNTEISFQPKTNTVTSIALDLLILTVDSILFQNNLINFTYNDTLIEIDFPTALTNGTGYKLKVFYQGQPIQISGDWGGFFWNNTYAYNVGVSFTEEVHNFGKAWFPCFDNFTERSTFDFAIKTQGSHKAFCNGLLQSQTVNVDGTKNWYWKLNQRIPTYLASVAVANYQTVHQDYNGIPIQLAARQNDTTNLKNSFIHLNDAMASYENRFGPYRFERVGYCVTSFSAGAMEHATNITYMSAAVNGNTQWETLMAHELSHHWWGNNTTCSTAEDMWLNEGFASYAEGIFTESVYGTEAYKDYERDNHDLVLRRVHHLDGEYLPVAGVPTEHTYSSAVYSKGADMIHTLRGILGDDVFFDGLKIFQNDNAFDAIDTDMFEEFLSTHSNLNLKSFFKTWIKEKGFHHFEIADISLAPKDNAFEISGTIKQKLWQANSFTDFLPIPITFFDAQWNKVKKKVFVYGECSQFRVDLDFEPIFWAIDLEEEIQDATVDKYLTISNPGVTSFGLGRIDLDVQSISDSAFVRVTHHYIKPDPMNEKIPNLHPSPNRYWSFDGIFPTDFETNGTFLFNGSTNATNGLLDNDFINNSEDSLVMMYRPNNTEEWTIHPSFTINTQGSTTNKMGNIYVEGMQKGDYVLAIYDKNKTQDTDIKTECLISGILENEKLDNLVKIFPNPAKDFINIELNNLNLRIQNIEVFDNLGRKVDIISVNGNNKKLIISTANYSRGSYLITFKNKLKENLLTKKIFVD